MLIASKGRMPQEFARHTNNRHAAEIVRKISQDSRAAKMIDNHAHRLPGGTVKKVTGISLRQHIAHQIDVGAHEAVVLTTPVAIAKAAARTDAPKPVSQMSVIEKVTAALKLSIRHLPAELATAAAFTVIMEIGIFLAGLIPAQFIPVGGEVLDVALAAIAYAVAGLAGIYAVWQLVHATYIAASAKTDADLDEAGKEYAAGFVAIGVAKLAKLRAKLLEGRLGGAAEEVEGKASRNIGQRTSREPQPEESTQSSAKSNAAAATPSLEDLALAGSKPVRVLQGTNGKTAVIGRSMGDGSAPGVRSYAKAFENQFGPIETFDGPVISSGAKREWADLTSGGQRLTDSEIKETLLYKENVAWSENLKAKGYTILDLGDPAMQDASAFYEIEKKVIFGD
ncbi:MAG: hypothetical protein ABIU18_05145 [Novosphingobium sp.]